MAKKDKAQPGVMLYFSELMSIRNQLTREEKGWLLDSITDYGSEGKLPDFSEFPDDAQRRYIESIWNFFKSAIERDFARYIKNKEVKIRANRIKFIKSHPELNLDPTNEADISCIVTDERTGKLVYDPQRAYENEQAGKGDFDLQYLPSHVEEAKRQQAERLLTENPLGLNTAPMSADERIRELRKKYGMTD